MNQKPNVPQGKPTFAVDQYVCALCGARGSAEALCFPRPVTK